MTTATADEFFLANGYPKVAEKIVCVDFDDTMFPTGPLFGDRPPFPGVPEGMRKLKQAGYEIVILTSRLSKVWIVDEDQSDAAHIAYIMAQCLKYKIPWDKITADKQPARVYFDDKAVHVGPGALGRNIDLWLRAEER